MTEPLKFAVFGDLGYSERPDTTSKSPSPVDLVITGFYCNRIHEEDASSRIWREIQKRSTDTCPRHI